MGCDVGWYYGAADVKGGGAWRSPPFVPNQFRPVPVKLIQVTLIPYDKSYGPA
jgi:hypothetical protein